MTQDTKKNLLKIPSLKVYFPPEDIKEILSKIEECLSTGMLAQGKNVQEFEKQFASYLGTQNAICVSSGGSAIEVVMRALNVKEKEVLVPANTFLATASSVVLAGGNSRLVDISPKTLSPTLESLKKSITKNTTGVIIVHIGGIISEEIEEIRNWCNEKGLWLFEDCAHAHGSMFHKKMAGTFGLGSAYSFFATKVITCGEGGIVVTSDNELAKKVRILRDYGKTEPWVSYHVELGANWRMSDITAVIGLAQLKRLNEFINFREKIASLYTKFLETIPEVNPILSKDRCSWYKYIILLPNNKDREKLRIKMKENGVSLSGGVYDVPLHKQPVFKSFENEPLHNAEDFCRRHICLPIYYGMKNEEVEYVVETLKNCLKTI